MENCIAITSKTYCICVNFINIYILKENYKHLHFLFNKYLQFFDYCLLNMLDKKKEILSILTYACAINKKKIFIMIYEI